MQRGLKSPSGKFGDSAQRQAKISIRSARVPTWIMAVLALTALSIHVV